MAMEAGDLLAIHTPGAGGFGAPGGAAGDVVEQQECGTAAGAADKGAGAAHVQQRGSVFAYKALQESA